MKVGEPEIQLLASVRKAELEGISRDRTTLEALGERYLGFIEDWTDAYASLLEKGLVDRDQGSYGLTQAGRPLADAYHRERPDHYWYYYQRFYPAAHASAAHSLHCERVYGKDLCQEGQMDMAELGDLLALMNLEPGQQVLDLGCGAGGISEYISDVTGATLTGIDNASSAVAEAEARTAGEPVRLRFFEGDLNTLDLPAASFDAVIMVDSIYWAADMTEALSSICRSIRAGGQLAVVIAERRGEDEGSESLEIDETLVAEALGQLRMDYRAHDRTEQFLPFWPRIKQSMVVLRTRFEAEGNGFICDELEREADEDFLPAIRAGKVRRYLYHVRP